MKGNFFFSPKRLKKKKKKKKTSHHAQKKKKKRLIQKVWMITDKLGQCINFGLDCISVCPVEGNSDNW